jgi:hypothetical protein
MGISKDFFNFLPFSLIFFQKVKRWSTGGGRKNRSSGGRTGKREQCDRRDVLGVAWMTSIEALQAHGGGQTHVGGLLKAELWQGMDATPSPWWLGLSSMMIVDSDKWQRFTRRVTRPGLWWRAFYPSFGCPWRIWDSSSVRSGLTMATPVDIVTFFKETLLGLSFPTQMF